MEKKEKPKFRRPLYRKIINGFIIFFVAVFLVLVLLLGFSQTSTFREFLRDKAVDIVSESISGKFELGSIDGTIFTSLFLNDIKVYDDVDTLLIAKKIEVKVSPLQILLRKIYIRNIELKDVSFRIYTRENGETNLNAIFASPDTTLKIEADSTDFEKVIKEADESSPFPLQIEVVSLEIKNLEFRNQSGKNRGVYREYSSLNSSDLWVKNLNLRATMAANFRKQNIFLNLEHLSAEPNLKKFKLRELSSKIFVSNDYAEVRDFTLVTDSTDLKIDARLEELNLFGDLDSELFRDFPARISLDAKKFCFADLSSFVEATNILNGTVKLALEAEGDYADLNINKLDLSFRNSRFNMSGRLENLHIPSELYIDVKIDESKAEYRDVNYLLPKLQLPQYPDARLTNFDLWMKGEPTKFRTGLLADTEDGNINLIASMNLQKNKLNYSAEFLTENIDIEPFTGIKSVLNSTGRITGAGTDPAEMITEFKLELLDSKIDVFDISELSLNVSAQNSLVDLDLKSQIDSARYDISGYFDFVDTTRTEYDFTGTLQNVNLSKLILDDYFQSDINMSFLLEGKYLEIDSTLLNFNIALENSSFRTEHIDHAGMEFSIDRTDTNRTIKLKSDFLDFNIDGDFSIDTAITLLSYQSETILDIIEQKAEGFNPIGEDSLKYVNLDSLALPEIAYTDINFNFDYQLKDLTLIALLLGEEQFDAAGQGDGRVSNKGYIFEISSDFNLDYFIRRNDDEILYFSDVELNVDFNRDNRVRSFENLFGAVSLTGKRIHFGQNLNDIELDLIFNQSKLFYNTKAKFEDYLNASLSGDVELSNEFQEVNLTDFVIDYRNNIWANTKPARIMYRGTDFIISDFNVSNNEAEFILEGLLKTGGEQDFSLSLTGLNGEQLNNLFAEPGETLYPDGTININSNIEGTIFEPEIEVDVEWGNLKYGESLLGVLDGKLRYYDRLLDSKFQFFTSGEKQDTLIELEGGIPINLGFVGVKDRIIPNEEINLLLYSNQFDLSVLGNSLPNINEQSGILSAIVEVKGDLNEPKYNGEVKIENGKFVGEFNGLDYILNAKSTFNEKGIVIEYVTLQNGGDVDVQNIGEMNLTGNIKTENLSLNEISLNLDGNLTVLSDESRSVSPNVYGELFIATDGNWVFDYKDGVPFFKGTVLLEQMDLTYSPGQVAYNSNGNNYNIVFVVDSSQIDKQKLKFEQIVENSAQKKRRDSREVEQSFFDYELDIKVVNEANLEFLLSRASNQRLIADIAGDLKLQSKNGVERAQGGFTLLEGSKLEFFRVLDATGSIKFESDLANPYLDIIATYKADYENPPNYQNQTVEVAAKLKLTGTLDELGTNLANNPENISVYVGTRNIQNNIPDESYDASDALSFIIVGKFKEDLTPEDQTQVASNVNLIENTATSFLGSVLTGFVNSALGDYVNNIQLSQTSEYTKFSVSGKYQRFRYSIGGTTEVFENIGKANLRLAYMFSNNLLLRVERKDPVVQTTGYEEKVNEVGLQYKIEF